MLSNFYVILETLAIKMYAGEYPLEGKAQNHACLNKECTTFAKAQALHFCPIYFLIFCQDINFILSQVATPMCTLLREKQDLLDLEAFCIVYYTSK